MTVKILTALLSAIAIFAGSFASEAQSREDGGYYISGFGGLSFQSGQTNRPLAGAGNTAIELDYDSGFVLGGSIGYKLPESSIFSGFRLELEASYREGDVEDNTNLPNVTSVTGDTSSFGVLANVLYDFDQIASDFFIPYIGIGAGIAGVESDVVINGQVSDVINEPDSLVPFRFQFGGDTRTQFVYQGIVGATFPISDKFDFFIDGRYYSAGSVQFDNIITLPQLSEAEFDSDYDVIQVQAGFRFHF
jgi:opacity protein-like surface antigen